MQKQPSFRVYKRVDGSSESDPTSQPCVLCVEKTFATEHEGVTASSAIVPTFYPIWIHEKKTISHLVGNLVIVASTHDRCVDIFMIRSPDLKGIKSSEIVYLKNLEKKICERKSRRAYETWKYKVISLESSNSGTFCLTVQELIRMIVTITIDDYKTFLEDKSISIQVVE